MSEKIIFCIEQYFLLMLLFVSTLGWGRLATTKMLTASATIPRLSEVVLQATAGLGLVTLFCILIASYGALTVFPLLAILAAGIVLTIPSLITIMRNSNPSLDSMKISHLGLIPSVLVFLAAAAVISNALVRPLTLPLGWDEVAYHLPTAQAWAESGRLVVTDWLRYTLFPFNMELLYAGALILGNDVTAHLVHAFTGFLAIALTFSVARIFVPVPLAALASVFLFYAIKQPLLTADIELGLMLYIFGAFATLGFCYLEKRKSLTFLAAFFIGLALGTKYQAMFFLPALAVAFLMIERDWKMLGLAALVVILTGSYWYARNFFVSGDPIHPFGGSVMGYWLWNADDIRRQFLDLQGVRKLPPWYLLLSAGSPIFWRTSALVLKGSMVATFVAVFVWFIVSGYDRYLMPIYPMLAILSSYFLYRLFTVFSGQKIFTKYWEKLGRKAQLAFIFVILLSITYDWGKSTYKDIKELVLPDSFERITLLQDTYPGYELLSALDMPLFGTLYQLGFEDEIYYLGTPILGDHVGKARYRGVLLNVRKSADLSSHLRSIGAKYLMVNLVRHTTFIDKATADPSFYEHFEVLSTTPRAVLYEVKEVENTSTSRVMKFTSDKL